MANPVNNSGINAKVDLGGALKADVETGGSARVSDNQSKGIFQNVNENYTKNPNHSRGAGHGGDGNQTTLSTAQNADTPPAQTNPPPAPNEDTANDVQPPRSGRKLGHGNLDLDNDAASANRPNRDENGAETGRGPQKIGGQGQTQGQTPTRQGPPNLILPTDNPGNQQTGNPTTGTPLIIPTNGNQGNQTTGTPQQNTPPIIFTPARPGNGNHYGHYKNLPVNPPVFTTGKTNRPGTPPLDIPNMGVKYSVSLNLRANGNQPFGLIRQVVAQVLRQNDIYLGNNTINRLINNQSFQNPTRAFTPAQVVLPRAANNFIQTIGRQVLSMLDNPHHSHRLIHQISKEISRQLREEIQSVRHQILKSPDLQALHFRHLNLREKMHVAVELLPQHLPPKAFEQMLNHQPREVLDGLLLTRGLIVPNERAADARNLVALKSSVWPPEVSMTALRDVGHLVKTLIADTASAKTTASLDLAVQKFVKILLANNELGVLMATVSLAAQSQNGAGSVGRSLALAQIYDLINQLIQAGEKALKEAAPEKNVRLKERNIFQPETLSAVEDFDESKIHLNRTQTTEAAGSLRQFLEFNPAFVYDNSASVFNNPEDARQAQKDFINLFQDDIAAWLESGKHRFVKDFDFDRPVGVGVERGRDGVFTASTARFVLVRDGSVQGWHFLKTFLVK